MRKPAIGPIAMHKHWFQDKLSIAAEAYSITAHYATLLVGPTPLPTNRQLAQL
jgi:hypothetical protein